MVEETTQKKIIDLATILTIGGIILYQMGWLYWKFYFANFDIDSSFIDMPFEKFIATTWHFFLIVIGGFILTLLHFYEDDKDELDIQTTIFVTCCSVLILLFNLIEHTTLIYIYILTLVFYGIIKSYYVKKKLPSKKIKKSIFLKYLLLMIYALCLLTYIYSGDKASKKFISDYKRNDIEITLNHDNKIIIGKFITFMNSKYFLLIKDKRGQNETLIINDSEIYHTKIIK